FLLKNAMGVSGENTVLVQTTSQVNSIQLRIEDRGTPLPPDALPRFFEPVGTTRPGADRLELATCRTLVRRLQGKLKAENRAEEGVTILVELPASSSGSGSRTK